MIHRLHHERLFRGSEAIRHMASARVTICGAGALGSNLAVNLSRQGFENLTVIDHDRIEPHNIGNQVYSQDDVGGLKAEILGNIIFRELQIESRAVSKKLTIANADRLLRNAQLVVDAFDNSESRGAVSRWCTENAVACLHVGLDEKYGEIRWNDFYKVPTSAGGAVCDYPLARNLVLLATAVASEVIVRFVLESRKENYAITFGDLSIHHESF